MTRHPTRSIEDWTEALDLKRRGVEYVGPCPLCGGEDRFHVRTGRYNNAVLVGCRGCMDGQAQDLRRARFGEALRAAFGADRRGSASKSGPGRPYKPLSQGPATRSPSTTEGLAGWLQAASELATWTPAHYYLAKRWAWPPPGDGCPSLPSSVRWLNRRGGFGFGKLNDFPASAAGVILFVYRNEQGNLAAVSLEALTQDGDRPDWKGGERWRRTYGLKTGATFEGAPGTPGRAVVLVEGEVTALACRWLHPGCRVLACGGGAGLRGAAELVASGAVVVIEADGDTAGRAAAADLSSVLLQRGHGVTLRRNGAGDAADTLKEDLEQRAAIIEHDGGLTQTEADRDAWREYLERRDHDGRTAKTA